MRYGNNADHKTSAQEIEMTPGKHWAYGATQTK